MAAGWDRSTAEMRAAFVLLGQQSGMTYDEAFANYATYEQAVRDGDVELSRQMLATLQSWETEYGTTWATITTESGTAAEAIQGNIDGITGKTSLSTSATTPRIRAAVAAARVRRKAASATRAAR